MQGIDPKRIVRKIKTLDAAGARAMIQSVVVYANEAAAHEAESHLMSSTAPAAIRALASQ